MKKRFLVIGAHPDDADFAFAGTAAKIAKEGGEVFLGVVTDGSKGEDVLKQKKGELLAKKREEEQKNSAKIVGIRDVYFLREKDGEIENDYNLRKKLVRIIREIRPDIVVSFDPGNFSFEGFYRFHRDHRISAVAVFDAVYPAAGSSNFFPELLKEELNVHSVNELWFFSTKKSEFTIDISDTIDIKIKSLLEHKSQIKDKKKFAEKIRERAKKEGNEKISYGESFRKIKMN